MLTATIVIGAVGVFAAGLGVGSAVAVVRAAGRSGVTDGQRAWMDNAARWERVREQAAEAAEVEDGRVSHGGWAGRARHAPDGVWPR